MGTRIFPGSRVGMANVRANIQTFKDYVEAYFDDFAGIVTINLIYLPNYTARIKAVNDVGQTITMDMPISRHDLREMLAGTTRELNIIYIRWTKITIRIKNTGVAEVIVNW